jgi:hypothetical protein
MTIIQVRLLRYSAMRWLCELSISKRLDQADDTALSTIELKSPAILRVSLDRISPKQAWTGTSNLRKQLLMVSRRLHEISYVLNSHLKMHAITVSELAAILGMVLGTAGLVMGLMNYLRDRPKIKVNMN